MLEGVEVVGILSRDDIVLLNYQVWAMDGEIGSLDGFVIDGNSWHLGYLDVKAGHWLHERSVLIPTGCVSSISWAGHKVHLRYTQEGIGAACPVYSDA